MKQSVDEIQDGGLAAEYVLGLLEGSAKADADRLFASDAAFALEVERWRQRFAAFDDTAEPHDVGDPLWQRIEAAISTAAPAIQSRSGIWSRWWNSVAILRASAMGASLAALA